MNNLRASVVTFVLMAVLTNYATSQSDSASTRNVNFLGLPTIGYSQSYGLQLGAIGMLTFNVDKTDTLSPPSSLNLMGFYTTNKTWFGLLSQRLYFNQNNWRITWAAGTGDNNFQFYSDEIPGSGGVYIDYATTSLFGFVSASRRVYDQLYIGLSYSASSLNTTFYLEEIIGSNPDTLKTLASTGIPITYDSRDNIFNPTRGYNINLRSTFYRKWMGSDLDFSSLSFNANYYLRLNDNAILASRITAYTGLGDIPFEGQRVVGGTDLRGYSKGKHRGNKIYSAQSEYRHSFNSRTGFVAFAGLAASFNSGDENNNSGILPGIGAGFRYLAIRERSINIGIDAAAGIGDWGVYFRIGEAF